MVEKIHKIGIQFFGLKICLFCCHNANKAQNVECHTLLSSKFNFQSITVQSKKFLIFAIFRKKSCEKCENGSKNKCSLK